MAEQVDLAHPTLAAGGHAEGGALVVAQAVPAFEQRHDSEGVGAKGGQAQGQRALLVQPVEFAAAGGRAEAVGGKPCGAGGSSLGHGGTRQRKTSGESSMPRGPAWARRPPATIG
ncbi:hypothetical protein D9M73_219330 [compost metagenome]